MSNIDLNIGVGKTKTITFNTKDTYNTENIIFNITAEEGKETIDYSQSAEPTQTGNTVTKTNNWVLQYLTQAVNWLRDNKVETNSNATLTSLNIKGTANSIATITADQSKNLCVSTDGNIPFVVFPTIVCPGINNSNQISLGVHNQYWKEVWAGKYKIPNGTSSQFLKADGSVDSTSYQQTISDLTTIRRKATNGNTAYNWGNHANAGYITSTSLATIRTGTSTVISSTTKWFDMLINNYVLDSTLTANVAINKVDIGTILTECLGFECTIFTDIIDFGENTKALNYIISSISKLGIKVFVEHDTEDVCTNGYVAILEFNVKNNIIIIKAYRLIT